MFHKLGRLMEKFDTDKMNIGRRQTITNPDGSTGETSPKDPIYTDVPCHISFEEADNPDNAINDTVPIISVVKVHCRADVDLQNNDYVTAFRLSESGEVLETYEGSIGFPVMHKNRQVVLLSMKQNA